MNNILKHSIKLLNKNQKFKLIIICFLTLIGALLETLGVGIVVPFLSIFIESDTKNSFFEHTFLSSILKTENIIFFKNYNPILSGSLIILIIFTIKNFYLLYLQWFNAKFTFDVETSLSKRLLDLYLSQKYSFFLKRNSANLIRNIKEEVVYFRAKIVNQIYTVFIDLLTIFCILILLIFINPQASIFAIVFMVLASLIYLSFTKTKIKRLAIQRQYHDEIRLKSLQHSFTGIKQIKVSGSENFFSNIFNFHNTKTTYSSVMHDFIIQIPRYVLEIFAIGSLFILILVFFRQNLNYTDLIPLLGVYAVASFKILPSANRLTQALNQIRSGVPTVELLHNELNKLQIIKRQNEKFDKKEFKNLKINNLNFSYIEQKNVLNNVNLSIKKGDVVGVIGNSGAGKSTLIDIIIGLLNPTQGEVYFNDLKLKDNDNSWLNIIGYVPQEIFILDDTLLNNITFGSEGKRNTKSQVSNLIELLELKEFVNSLPEGLNTNLNERGTRISGGQKQRIGIARALYNNPDIIILDEATNALDKNLEHKILKNIKKLENKTIIIISHNLESFKENCNQVFEIKDGYVKTKGQI
jgi:ATP-binding cassette, subfamily B, bacterial PglK